MAVSYEVDDGFRVESSRMLFEGHFVPPWWGAFEVSADGQRFLMVEHRPNPGEAGELVLVQNWFEELERLVPTDRR